MDKVSFNSNIYSGAGSAKDIFAVLAQRGWKSVGWIIDQNLTEVPYIREIVQASDAAGIKTVEKFAARATQEPDYDYLDEVASRFRPLTIDGVVGIGGGTACDIAKAVGLLMKNPGRGIDYRGMDLVKQKGVPVVLMPTTAGTGTECTQTASFNDLKENRKLGINGRNVDTEFAVLDPVLTVSCPRSVTLSSGLDAMVHAIEAVTAVSSNPFSRAMGSIGFKVLYDNFVQVIEQPSNIEARMNMLAGSHFAGLAMANVGGGPASGISYPLGVCHKVPHGIAGGIFLGHVFEMNVAKGYSGYAALNNLIDPKSSGLTDAQKAAKFVENFWKLYRKIGGPENLRNFGLSQKDAPLLVQLTMTQRQANLAANPAPCTEQDVKNLLERVLA